MHHSGPDLAPASLFRNQKHASLAKKHVSFREQIPLFAHVHDGERLPEDHVSLGLSGCPISPQIEQSSMGGYRPKITL